MNLGGPRVGFTRGAFDSLVHSVYPLTGSIATVGIQTPRRRTDAWGTPRLLTFQFITTVLNSNRRGRGKGKNGPWTTRSEFEI